MDNKNSSKAAGCSIGFLDLLLVAFIVLKICKVITWSWWWVLAPLWVPLAICAVLSLIITIMED